MSIRISTLTALLGLTFLASIQSQTVLRGYVTIQNTGHQSAFPAQIQVANTDLSTTVDSIDGRFELTLPPQYTGKDVLLTLLKPNFEQEIFVSKDKMSEFKSWLDQ